MNILKLLFINTMSIALIALSIVFYTVSIDIKEGVDTTSEKIEKVKLKLPSHVNDEKALALIINMIDTMHASSQTEVETFELISEILFLVGFLNFLVITPQFIKQYNKAVKRD